METTLDLTLVRDLAHVAKNSQFWRENVRLEEIYLVCTSCVYTLDYTVSKTIGI